MTQMVRTHPFKSRRPLSFGHPQHDLAASVAAFDQARQLVEPRPLACVEHAVKRLVLLVEGRERAVSLSQTPKPSPNAPLNSKDPSGLATTLSLSIL